MEYVRNIMCLTDGIEEHPTVKLLEGKVFRSFTNSTKFKNAVVSNLRTVTMRNYAGYSFQMSFACLPTTTALIA